MTDVRPETETILAGLKDFQRLTVDYVFQRLYLDPCPTQRFLIADEVGLGKTLVAKGLIAKAINHLWEKTDRIDIIYICSNSQIARQNINRLNITENGFAISSRITMLPHIIQDLNKNKVNLITLTPGTSFNLRSSCGIIQERAFLYNILRKKWGFGGKAGPLNVFQADAGKHNWRKRVRKFKHVDYNSDIIQGFYTALEKSIDQDLQDGRTDLHTRFEQLSARFGRVRRVYPPEDRKERNAIIGELRSILAASCIRALRPDIIILDEFQRFKDLLDGKDQMSKLARELFEYNEEDREAKVILLSATPYKMYTMQQEPDGEDHYEDFTRTIQFLVNSDGLSTEFTGLLGEYRKGLYRIGSGDTGSLDAVKESIEQFLRQVMVRTERLSVSVDRNAMVREAKDNVSRLNSKDLWAFVTVDRAARRMGAGDHTEYWKSAPYILNFMDHYRVKQKLSKHLSDQNLYAILHEGRDTLLSWQKIQRYRKIDPQNFKLRQLMAENLQSGWQYLWIPPSLPYYQPGGVYAGKKAESFTKSLVFSSWRVVPKVIAALCSYEAERRIMAGEIKHHYSEVSEKRVPLLQFSFRDNRLTGMALMTMIYPCLTLATRVNVPAIAREISSGGRLPSAEEIESRIAENIGSLLEQCAGPETGSGGRADERWYWASLALLDRHFHKDTIQAWLGETEEKYSWRFMVRSRVEADGDTRFADHVDGFHDFFDHPHELGRRPDDLVQVLTKSAMASPAIAALRSFGNMLGMESLATTQVLSGAARIAQGFRTLYNLPETTALIRRRNKDEPYWERTLEYGINGNLQAVLDEYFHIMYESLGLMGKPENEAANELADAITSSVSLRTTTAGFDEIEMADNETIRLIPRKLRCRYALAFGEAKNEEDGEKTREEQVRTAFNSPFRPFVLATTSVGQEGLDFHQYCHSIYHWNLPSNPVDLEQREGRIHRYKGHVIRKNIAGKYGSEAVKAQGDPWRLLFSRARKDYENVNELIPFWIFDDGVHRINRYVPMVPMCREQAALEDLKRTLVLYRMVFGQPRQEDLAGYIKKVLGPDIRQYERFQIDLAPRNLLCP